MFIRLPRNGDADTTAPDILTDLAAAIGLIAHNAVWPVLRPASALTLHAAADQQLGKDGGLMSLARRQQQRQELACTVSPEVDFYAEAALAPPKRFGFGISFFAPDACWWARMMVLSRKCTFQSSWPVASACCFTMSNRR
jgi:hypothetical protein